MSESELDHLVKMANQIAANIGVGASEEVCVDKTAQHIRNFWAAPMRRKILANLEAVRSELAPITFKALTRLTSP